MDVSEPEKIKLVRGKGRGSRFFALDREQWPRLWTLETVNRFNLVATYLVLLAGTGSDHQLTKWSTKACEQYVGIGKPRARLAIEELIRHGIVSRTDSSTQAMPQYKLLPLDREANPIFLPVQLVTGFNGEASILRRLRETGDAFLLRMLIDLYGQLETDAAYGVPINAFRRNPSHPARKLFEVGANAVWAMELGTSQTVNGDWIQLHRVKPSKNVDAWHLLWERISLLVKIGAIWFEPWVFDGDALDAEPLLPVDPNFQFSDHQKDGEREAAVTRQAYEASVELAGERTYLIDRAEGDILIPLPCHHRPPEIRGVVRMRVEADSIGRRIAYAKRMNLIESYGEAFVSLRNDAQAGRYNRPVQTAAFDQRGHA